VKSKDKEKTNVTSFIQ